MKNIEKQPNKPGLIALSVAIAVAIFLVDLSLPLGVAGGVPYVAVVLLGWWFDRPGVIFSLALLGSVLTAAGYFLSPEGGVPWMVAANRFLALLAIWVVAVLLAKAKHAEAALRTAHDDLERRVEARTKEIRTANEALRESEERFRATFEQAAVGICHISPDGRFLRVNQKLCEITGYGQDELLEKTFRDITHPDDLEASFNAVQRLVAGDIGTHSTEKRYLRKDGTIAWVSLTASLVRQDSGAPSHFIAVSADITERKQAELALHRLGIAVEGVSEIIALYDAEDRLILFNGAFRDMNREAENSITLGMTFEELARTLIAKGLVPEAAGREEAWLRERLERHRNPGGPVEIARQDGIWLLTHEQRLPDGGTITISQDITASKRAEESERQLRSQLAHASRLSTVGNMAAGLAHEINQPLAAIGGYVQAGIRLLRSGKGSTEDVIADLEKASQQVTRAADIVKWLRGTVAKGETEKTELNLNACIAEVTDFLKSELHARKCELVVDLADSLPAIKADKVQIQQVILNLLQNSMEAADQSGGTGCRLQVRTSASTDGTVQVEIEDDGPGVSAEIRDDVFSPFVTTKSDGLGFGLSISKSIVEAHGGRIWTVPNAGRGATFAFTLPVIGEAAP